jgi:glutamate--glyoxylate aminotransferase
VTKLLDSAKLQVMDLCQAQFLMDDPHVGLLFPSDAIARAKKYLAMNTGGVGMLKSI